MLLVDERGEGERGNRRGNNTVCTSGVIACDAMLIMRKVARGMGKALGCCKISNWGKVFLINASGELKIILSAI